MQTEMDVTRFKPLGTHILIKRIPDDIYMDKFKKIEIPLEFRDRNDLKGPLFTGSVIAVGHKTKSAKFGKEKGWFEPGDKIWLWAKWDWRDHEVVIKDKNTKEDYLVVDESDVSAYALVDES